MSLLNQLPDLIQESKAAYDEALAADLSVLEQTGSNGSMLALCDNVRFAKYLTGKGLAGKVQTIYLDPPFLSGSDYDAKVKGPDGRTISRPAYTDTWKNDEAGYIRMLCSALWASKELLSPSGLLFLHLDWHFVHYMKVAADEILGRENFLNEIIWQYKSGGSTKKHFARKHDTILMYSGSGDHYIDIPKEKSYNRDFKPYRFKGVEEFEDEFGWYTMVNMKDVWSVDMVGRTAAERTGYATQKPEALLERIVKSSSREGDICADLFCGSGTLPVVCAKTGRRFLACDIGRLAVSIAKKRLSLEGAPFAYMTEEDRSGSARVSASLDTKAGVRMLTLKGYSPDIKKLDLSEKDEPVFRAMSDREGLNLIDTVSVDPDYDGNIHHPSIYSAASDLNGYALPVPGSGKISVVITDIFGNESSVVL